MAISRFRRHVDKLPTEPICDNVEASGLVANVHDVVGEYGVPPPGMCRVEGGAEEMISKGLAVGF